MPSVLRQDAYSPILLASPTLTLTDEQRELTRRVLNLSSSDSFFAEKAYNAIRTILLGTNIVVPVLHTISPVEAVIGSPSFVLTALGSNFNPSSKIFIAGVERVTTFVSSSELSTPFDMTPFTIPRGIPVSVVTDNVVTDPKIFQVKNA